MIKLYGFGRYCGLSDLSPFVTKVDVYLRLMDLPFETVPFSFEAFRQAPKGKYPCIDDHGERVADSNFILDYLKHKYGDPLDGRVAPSERAIGHSVKRMLEEHTYWVMVAERWRDTDAARRYPLFENVLGAMIDAAVANMKGELHGQGVGRHSADEAHELGKRDFIALSDVLADRPYLLGDDPTSYDATVYAWLAHTIQPDYDSRMQRFVRTVPNLMRYWERLTPRLYPAA